MQKIRDLLSFLFVFLCSFSFVLSDLTINGVQCGQVTCKRGEYCGIYHKVCESCAPICDSTSHNFDSNICTQNCQDYIHDSRYISKDDIGSGNANLRETVQRLSHMVTVVLTLVCFILLALAIVLFIQVYRWTKKKNITVSSIKQKYFTKKSDSNPNNKTNNTSSQGEKPDLRLEIPTPGTQSDHSPVTMTTSISRRPAEDSALDYAYDNPAMTTTPGVKSSERSF